MRAPNAVSPTLSDSGPREGGLELSATDLERFRPGTDGDWDRSAASHLARRAAFGAPPGLVERLLASGPERGAQLLLEPAENDDGVRLLTDVTERLNDLGAVRAWWLWRMLFSPSPAVEKLALFWHGHFATSNRKVERPRLLMGQVRLFQRHGSGAFGDLLLEVARDPAMVIWLDGNSNRRGEPNENFARELMELFSLGLGNYTEEDIREIARCFTGWHERHGEFYFNSGAHDDGTKSIFGREGPFGGEDAVRLCAERRACARFIAGKLFRFYVHPHPSERTLDLLADRYEVAGRATGPFLADLWSSRAFYREDVRGAIVASPVDFAVGSLATLDARIDTKKLAEAIGLMGQELLEPPSVKGWDGGDAWLDSTTLLARYRFAVEVTGDGGGALDARVPWEALEAAGPDGVIARLFPDGLATGVHSDLVEAAAGDIRLLVAGGLELPEYQYI